LDRVLHKQFIKCKYCNSGNIVKYGTFQGMQRYFCKDCRRKFADNDSLPGMKTPIWIISLALSCYFDGMSLAAIQKEINQRHGAYYAQSSIYYWIIRFSAEAARQAQGFQPNSGGAWFVSKTPAARNNQRLWFLDVFNMDSQYLLVSRLSESSTAQDVIEVLDSIHISGKRRTIRPIAVYLSGITVSEIQLIKTEKGKNRHFLFRQADETSRKLFGLLLKKRCDVVHSFKNMDKAQTTTEAWTAHYNFLAENNQKDRKTETPPFKSWDNIIERSIIKVTR
jgi:putative transposase